MKRRFFDSNHQETPFSKNFIDEITFYWSILQQYHLKMENGVDFLQNGGFGVTIVSFNKAKD